MGGFKLNTSKLMAMAEAKVRLANKAAPEVCNRAVKSVILTASKMIPVANAVKMRAELSPELMGKIINSSPNHPKTRKGMKQAQAAKRRARHRSIGYNQLAVRRAGRPYGLFLRVKEPKGWASESTGKPARMNFAEATFTIVAPGAEKVVGRFIQYSVNAEAYNMGGYLKRRMERGN